MLYWSGRFQTMRLKQASWWQLLAAQQAERQRRQAEFEQRRHHAPPQHNRAEQQLPDTMAQRAATALANQDARWLVVQPPAAVERAPERTIEGINTLAGVAEIRQPQGVDPSPQFDTVKPGAPNPSHFRPFSSSFWSLSSRR